MPWSPFHLLMLAWFAGLLIAFVCLEYLYRGATLLLSHGRDCYTGLTPSRLASMSPVKTSRSCLR